MTKLRRRLVLILGTLALAFGASIFAPVGPGGVRSATAASNVDVDISGGGGGGNILFSPTACRTAMAPGDNCTDVLTVRNVGSLTFGYTITVWSDSDGIDTGAAGPTGDTTISCFNVHLEQPSPADGLGVGNNSIDGPRSGHVLFPSATETWGLEVSVDDSNACQGVTTYVIGLVQATGIYSEPTITNSLSQTTINTGTSVRDSAVLHSASTSPAATGSVIYNIYTSSSCTGATAVPPDTKPVSAGAVTPSNLVSFSAAGTYYWQAVYSGDANNLGATSACAPMYVNGNVYLRSDSPTPATGCGSVQVNGANPGGTSTVVVGLNSTVTWVNQPATFSSIGAGSYNVTLNRVNESAAANFRIQIGYCDGATFVSKGSLDAKFNGGTGPNTFTVKNVTAQTLTATQRFAVRIVNLETSPTNKQLTFSTNGSSFLTGPVH